MRSSAKITALIMAAARGPDDPMACAFNAEHKCLVKIDGIEMLVRVVQALKTTPGIEPICVSIDRVDVLSGISELEGLELYQSADSAPNSVVKAIDEIDHPFPLLVTTADHALLTRDMIEYFCQHAEKTKSDIAVGLAQRADIEQTDTTSRRTYFKFRDGDFSGCNLYYLKSEKALNAVRFWHKVDRIRKKPLALARTFGLIIMVKYMLGILTPKSSLEYASGLLDVRTDAIIIPYGEAAIDVDRPEDHALATRLLQQRR